MSELTDSITLIKEFLSLLSLKKLVICFLFSLNTTFCVFMFDDIFDAMYVGLIKTLCSLLLIFCVSWLMVEIIYAVARLWKRHRDKQNQAAKEFAQKEQYLNRINIIRALLLYLPSRQASILRYVYMNNGHGAYIPTDEISAENLQAQGCLMSRKKKELRGWGYEYETECYFYRVSSEIMEYLNEHLREMGQKWGIDIEMCESLKKYQRSGKCLHLE